MSSCKHFIALKRFDTRCLTRRCPSFECRNQVLLQMFAPHVSPRNPICIVLEIYFSDKMLVLLVRVSLSRLEGCSSERRNSHIEFVDSATRFLPSITTLQPKKLSKSSAWVSTAQKPQRAIHEPGTRKNVEATLPLSFPLVAGLCGMPGLMPLL